MSMLASRPVSSGKFFYTRVGESITVALGDGTSILLNSATRIALETHGRFREVHLLGGEAFFMGGAAVGLTAFGIELQRVLIWMTIEPISDSEDGARSLFAKGLPRITASLGGPSS
jgi:hypothetical protein